MISSFCSMFEVTCTFYQNLFHCLWQCYCTTCGLWCNFVSDTERADASDGADGQLSFDSRPHYYDSLFINAEEASLPTVASGFVKMQPLSSNAAVYNSVSKKLMVHRIISILFSCLLCPRLHRAEALSDDARLTSVCLSRTSGLRPISHCCEYSRRTFVGSTCSEYSEPVSKKWILIIDK